MLTSILYFFYEEPESGRMIQFRFIKNGLLKGQHSIYTTQEDTDISLIENEVVSTLKAIRKRIYCKFVKFQTLGTTRKDQ
jgi:hypothetical protein